MTLEKITELSKTAFAKARGFLYNTIQIKNWFQLGAINFITIYNG